MEWSAAWIVAAISIARALMGLAYAIPVRIGRRARSAKSANLAALEVPYISLAAKNVPATNTGRLKWATVTGRRAYATAQTTHKENTVTNVHQDIMGIPETVGHVTWSARVASCFPGYHPLLSAPPEVPTVCGC